MTYCSCTSCSRGAHLEVVRYLVSEAHCDQDSRNTAGESPLHTVCRSDRLQPAVDPIHSLYLGILPPWSRGVNVRQVHINVLIQKHPGQHFVMDKCSTTKLPGQAGLKALHNTRQRQPPESFWMLSLRDVLFMCPLFKDPCVVYVAPVVNTVLTCSRKGHLDIVRYLVGEASCDLNARDTNGYTPLHTACRYCYIRSCLLHWGVDTVPCSSHKFLIVSVGLALWMLWDILSLTLAVIPMSKIMMERLFSTKPAGKPI